VLGLNSVRVVMRGRYSLMGNDIVLQCKSHSKLIYILNHFCFPNTMELVLLQHGHGLNNSIR